MIVMEPGSHWPGPIGDVTELVAFCEEGEALLRRMQVRLGALRRSGQNVRVAVLACNPSTGDAAADRRLRLARVLLGAVSATTCGRLILSAKNGAPHSLRRELLALAGVLTEALRGTKSTVSVRFDAVN